MVISNTFLDYPDNESHALIVYFDGCAFHCGGCHNPERQIYKMPLLTPYKLYIQLLDESKKYGYTNKLVLSGGDPLFKKNIEYTKEFLSRNKFFNICIYTGHDIKTVPFIRNFNYMKLGVYQEENKQEQIKNNKFIQFASSNQMLVNNEYKILSNNGRFYYV